LSEILIDDILDRTRRHPMPTPSVRDFTERWASPQQHDYVIADGDFSPGVVSLDMLRYLPEEEWGTTPIIRLTRNEFSPARPDEHMEDVLRRRENSMTVIPVVDRESERFLEVVNSSNILQLVSNKGRA
jgi:hypothetical protein